MSYWKQNAPYAALLLTYVDHFSLLLRNYCAQKSIIWETLSISRCADSSTNTKTIKKVLRHVSSVTCPPHLELCHERHSDSNYAAAARGLGTDRVLTNTFFAILYLDNLRKNLFDQMLPSLSIKKKHEETYNHQTARHCHLQTESAQEPIRCK